MCIYFIDRVEIQLNIFMRNAIISLLVFALLQQANSLSCQIIDQKLPPNNTADCTPGFDFVVTGINAPFGYAIHHKCCKLELRKSYNK